MSGAAVWGVSEVDEALVWDLYSDCESFVAEGCA